MLGHVVGAETRARSPRSSRRRLRGSLRNGTGEARRGAGGVAGGEGGGAAAGGARRRRAELLAAEGRRPQARPRRAGRSPPRGVRRRRRRGRRARFGPRAGLCGNLAVASSGRGCAPRRASTAARTASTAASPSGSRSTGEGRRRRTSRIRCEWRGGGEQRSRVCSGPSKSFPRRHSRRPTLRLRSLSPAHQPVVRWASRNTLR